MDKLLKRPTDPYDPSWQAYRDQNPGLRLSLSAADAGGEGEGDGDDAGSQAADPDFSFLPDDFKGEDGSIKGEEFAAHYGELASFKATADEARAALPETPDGYQWSVPEDHVFVEGFDPAAHQVPVMGEDGKPVIGADGKPQTRDMTAADMIDVADPDLALLQTALHEAGADPALMPKLASIMANREIRTLMKGGETAAAERKALGPDAQSRLDTVERELSARLPADQAKAIFADMTSANAVRGLSALLGNLKTPPPSAANSGKIDNATASIDERIMAGLSGR